MANRAVRIQVIEIPDRSRKNGTADANGRIRLSTPPKDHLATWQFLMDETAYSTLITNIQTEVTARTAGNAE